MSEYHCWLVADVRIEEFRVYLPLLEFPFFLFSLKVDKHFLLSVDDSLKDKVKTPLVDHSLKVVNALKLRYMYCTIVLKYIPK